MCEYVLTIFIIFIITDCFCDYLYPGIQTTSSLPEIIINKNVRPTSATVLLQHSGPVPSSSSSGYYYPVPQPPNDILPPLQDEVPMAPIDNGYLPPPQNDYVPPFQADFQPFQPAAHPVYGIPTSYKQNIDSTMTEPFVRVVSMSCLDSTESRFFRALIQSSDFVKTPPVFAKSTFGCSILKKSNDAFTLNLEGIAVGNCGVRYCANKKMCLNLRLPTVQGLQLPEDRFISMQCAPQHSIASVIKSLGIKTQIIQPRTISFNTVASGGTQRIFRPHLTLYRKGNQLVEPGSSVLLGEELLLKATINDSEDWKFIKIGAIVMQQGIQSGTERKSVTLVDNDGCRVESMKSVCPNHPEQLTNKVTIVQFRAFLFQDVDGDEMLLNVRLYGCMHQKDCQQTKNCEEKVATSNTLNTLDRGRNLSIGRQKRSTPHNDSTSMVKVLNSNHTHAHYYSLNDISKTERSMNTDQNNEDDTMNNSIQDYESHLDFRVVLPKIYNTKHNSDKKTKDDDKTHGEYYYAQLTMDEIYNGYLIVGVVLIIGITCVVIICVLAKFKTNFKHSFYFSDY